MLKKLILVAVVAVVGLSLFLLYRDHSVAKPIVKDDSLLEIPVTTTQVTPGLEIK